MNARLERQETYMPLFEDRVLFTGWLHAPRPFGRRGELQGVTSDHLIGTEDEELPERDITAAQAYTDFLTDCKGLLLAPYLQVAMPPWRLSVDAQYMFAILGRIVFAHPRLRVRIHLERFEPGVMPFGSFRLQPLDKLKNYKPEPPSWLLQVRSSAASPTDSDPHLWAWYRRPPVRLLRRLGAGWVPDVEAWVAGLAEEQLKRDKKLLRAFAPQEKDVDAAADAAQVEVLFNREIVRRIHADKVAATVPFVSTFHKLPREVVDEILYYAMFNHAEEGPRIYPWRYRRHVYHNFVWKKARLAPDITDHMLVSRQHGKDAQDVLYYRGIWQLGSPAGILEFMRATRGPDRARVRYLELLFEADAMLKFLQPSLGFHFNRTTRRLNSQMAGADNPYLVTDFLADVQRECNSGVCVIVRVPWRLRQWHSGFVGTCYRTLCRWVVKAMEDALRPFPQLRERVRYFHEQHNLLPEGQLEWKQQEMELILKVRDEPEEWSWARLLDTDEEMPVVERPPQCRCGPPFDEE